VAVDLSADRDRLSRIVEECPPDALPDLLGELARAQAVASVRLHENGTAPAPPTNKLGRHLTADEVAELLGMSAKWCYDHADELGAVRLSARAVRFPESAVRRYITARTSR
jgi:predicted DNA-binding transcriptional regulator AlpA